MSNQFDKLIVAASQVLGEFKLYDDGKNAASVAAALRTKSGQIYTGVCVHLGCGIGTCAEHSAITEMLKGRETEIESIVALIDDNRILPPCGRCRELIVQINASKMNTLVLVKENLAVSIRELLPYHWLEQTA